MVVDMVKGNWTLEATRKVAQSFKSVAEPPDWVDRDAVAEDLVAGELRPSDVTEFAKLAKRTEDFIAGYGKAKAEPNERFDNLDYAKAYIDDLYEALDKARPATPSAVEEVCQKIEAAVNKQLLAERKEREKRIGRLKALRVSVSLTQWREKDKSGKNELLSKEDKAYLLNLDPNDRDIDVGSFN